MAARRRSRSHRTAAMKCASKAATASAAGRSAPEAASRDRACRWLPRRRWPARCRHPARPRGSMVSDGGSRIGKAGIASLMRTW